jgi:hypothetical protein
MEHSTQFSFTEHRKAEEYRELARECLTLAGLFPPGRQRDAALEMADQWGDWQTNKIAPPVWMRNRQEEPRLPTDLKAGFRPLFNGTVGAAGFRPLSVQGDRSNRRKELHQFAN